MKAVDYLLMALGICFILVAWLMARSGEIGRSGEPAGVEGKPLAPPVPRQEEMAAMLQHIAARVDELLELHQAPGPEPAAPRGPEARAGPAIPAGEPPDGPEAAPAASPITSFNAALEEARRESFYAQVYAAADQGKSIEEIALACNREKGEIELILNLRR